MRVHVVICSQLLKALQRMLGVDCVEVLVLWLEVGEAVHPVLKLLDQLTADILWSAGVELRRICAIVARAC